MYNFNKKLKQIMINLINKMNNFFIIIKFKN